MKTELTVRLEGPFADAVDRGIGMLVPCNVVVRAGDGGIVVDALDPNVMVEVTGEPDLAPVAQEVTQRLRAALDSLSG